MLLHTPGMTEQSTGARWHGTRVRLLAGDITQVSVDAVVNAANSALAGGGGVDGAIHAAAGPSVIAEPRERYDGCPTGSAVITSAGNLPARHIVHAVGPIWQGGSHDEAALLRGAYSTSLDLAAEAGDCSVAFAAISCGVYGYPMVEACKVAVDTCAALLIEHELPEKVIFMLFSSADVDVYTRYLKRLSLR